MSDIVLQSFFSISRIPRAVYRFEYFTGHAHTAPTGKNGKNPAPNDCAVWADKNFSLWINLKILRGTRPQRPPREKSKNLATRDFADWCLETSYHVSCHSDKNCRLWIDSKISRSAPLWMKSKALLDLITLVLLNYSYVLRVGNSNLLIYRIIPGPASITYGGSMNDPRSGLLRLTSAPAELAMTWRPTDTVCVSAMNPQD